MSAAATLAGAALNRGNAVCPLQARIVEVSSGKRRRPESVRFGRPVVQFVCLGGLELLTRPTGKERHINVEPDRTACPEAVTGLHQPPPAAAV